MKSSTGDGFHAWQFVTNHGHVLAHLAHEPDSRLRDIAAVVGITERTAAQIVDQLERAGYLTRSRTGRRNSYTVHTDVPLRHTTHEDRTVADLIQFLARPGSMPAAQTASADPDFV
jgi:hypothetical protein